MLNTQGWHLAILLFLLPHLTFAQEKQIAEVKSLRGEVYLMRGNQKVLLALGQKIMEETLIVSEDKSFVQFIFPDQTQVTLGPNGQLKLSQAREGKKPGLINLIGGRLRAEVPETKTTQLPKLIIKTKNTAMGVRGTVFEAAYNPGNSLTGLLTFKGSVGIVPLNSQTLTSLNALTQELSSASPTMVGVGQYSCFKDSASQVLPPVRISPVQIKALETNPTLGQEVSSLDSGNNQSAIPPGVNPQTLVPSNTQTSFESSSINQLKEGGYYHHLLGYVVPPENSPLDPNTGLPLPPSSVGTIDYQGEYHPPEGSEITEAGTIIYTINPTNGNTSDNTNLSAPQVVSSSDESLALIQSTELDYLQALNSEGNNTEKILNGVLSDVLNDLSDQQNSNSGITAQTNVGLDIRVSN